MAKAVGTGNLFQKDARSTFLEITGSRYDTMARRIEKMKGLPPLAFTKEQFREWVLVQLKGTFDGVAYCRYCRMPYTLQETATDHARPLDRRGSTGLDNLELTCKADNDQKGQLTPAEYIDLLRFLETNIPEGRQDVLSRLAKAVSLAAAMRSNLGVIGDLKKTGDWQAAQKRRRDARNAKKLGRF